MFCAVTQPDGTVIGADARSLLKKTVEDAKKAGLTFAFGTEMEFYLFRLDEDGEPTKIPYDRAGYMDIAPADKGENVRREVCLTLERMGIRPESSHHEEGPGQNEIDFRYADPVTAADNAVTFPGGGGYGGGPEPGCMPTSAPSLWRTRRATECTSTSPLSARISGT